MDKQKYIIAKQKFNDKTLIAYEDGELNPWDTTPLITIYDSSDNIILKHNLGLVRLFLGFVIFSDRDVFGFLYTPTNYESTNTIFFEFYKIIDNKIVSVNKFNIPIPYSNGNLEYKIGNPLNNIYTLVYGDLLNYDYCDFVYFNEGGFSNKTTIKNIDSLTDYYYFAENMIVNKTIIAHQNKYISIGLNFTDKEHYFCAIQDIELSFNHKYDQPTEIEENNTNILLMNTPLCLIEIKLLSNIDILHVEENYVYVLINYKDNTLLDISKKCSVKDNDSLLTYIENNKIIQKDYKLYKT